MPIAARRMSRIKASPAAVISAKAMEMARAGRDVIALSAGEPDFDTPDHVKAATVRAIGEGKTKYPPLTGIPELREAICRKLERENRLRYAPDQVLVCNGGKQVIFRNRLRGLRDRWRAGTVTRGEVEQRVRAWVAHAAHADTWRLRRAIFRDGWFAPRGRPVLGA